MLIPFIAMIGVLIAVAVFLLLAGKKKEHDKDLGDRRAGNPVHHPDAQHPQ